MTDYLFSWNFVQPSLKKDTIWRAAARPAFRLASAVWAPIFLGNELSLLETFFCYGKKDQNGSPLYVKDI